MTDVPNPSRATGDAALDGATGGAAIAEAGDGARARTIEQSTSGGAHVSSHEPELLTSPSPHEASQPPQLSLSEPRSLHVPEQSVNPPGQAARHVPS